MSLKPAVALVVLVLTAPSCVSEAPLTSSVQGTVLAEDGQPLVDATVYGLPELDMIHQIRTQTDGDGRFFLKQIPPGAVYLHAFKESDWYPYDFFSFFNTRTGPSGKVTVEPGATKEDVVIQMGRRAGALDIEIADENGAMLTEGVGLTFTRDDIPGNYGRGAGASIHSLLVPAVPFTMTIEAEGYKTWRSGVIKPESRKTLHITVRMQRL